MTNQEIDALVAEKVMGWELSEHAHSQDKWYYRKNGQIFGMAKFVKDWNPSTNISDAWRVVEKLYEQGMSWSMNSESGLPYQKGNEDIFFRFGFGYEATASTAPMAICLAALKAKEVVVTI